VLAKMGHQEPRPLLENLWDKSGDSDVRNYLTLLDDPSSGRAPELWEQPVRDWLEDA
jgi:hypothetical protein